MDRVTEESVLEMCWDGCGANQHRSIDLRWKMVAMFIEDKWKLE
jgi:hypothetical protein